MLYFAPKPDFTLLSKYYGFQTTPEALQKEYVDGYQIQVDWYYTDAMVEDITRRFTDIVNRYELSEHFDNLMFLILSKVQYMENALTTAIEENDNLHRAKELAGLLLSYEAPELKNTPTLTIKGTNGRYNVKDPVLSKWIGELIVKALVQGPLPLTLFNYAIDYLFTEGKGEQRRIDISKVKAVHNQKPQKTSSYISQYRTRLKAEFCYYLLPYLNGETSLAKPDGKNFSDKQLNFLYEMMILLDIIKPECFDSSMDYEPKDLIRNLLIKYANAFGIKGNQ